MTPHDSACDSSGVVSPERTTCGCDAEFHSSKAISVSKINLLGRNYFIMELKLIFVCGRWGKK